MTAVVWTLPDCPRCERVKQALRTGGVPVEVRDLRLLRSGEEPDVEAMTQLVMTGEEAPLVCIGGRFLDPEEIAGLMEGRDGCSNSNCHSPHR